MQKECETVKFHQTKPSFFSNDCDVIKIKEEGCVKYDCLEKAAYFVVKFSLIEDAVKIYITDIKTEPTNAGIGKSIFIYLLREAITMCNENQRNFIVISGFLSTADYLEGHWPDSLLAYKKLGKNLSLNFYITDMETDPAYLKCPKQLKKKRYTDIGDFFNPNIEKINSGYLHYNGSKKEIEAVIEEYDKYIQEKLDEIEEEKKRKLAEHQKLVQQGIEHSNKPSSMIDKIKKLLNI